ncbi:MAG: hypothetical protein KAV82_13815 [Phycisphaerae bacterium]|nr:hypothetical protein [Phycisphaerae bacterium]
MIEFKGECGHTIRAKDEDAGKVVRCSYCGREAPVPDEQEDQLSFLLNEVERTGEFESPRRKLFGKSNPSQSAARSTRSPGDFNPFAIALKMCYAAVIITVLIVSGKFAYKWWIDVDRPSVTARTDSRHGDGKQQPMTSGDIRTRNSPQCGLLRPPLPEGKSGIFINSVPPKAMVYVRRAEDASGLCIIKDPKVKTRGRTGTAIRLQPDIYEVAVVLEPSDPQLMAFPGYQQARRKFDDPRARMEARVKVLEDYFMPDRAKRIAIETRSDSSQVIVRYYEVEVVKGSWTPETALFLPEELELAELMNYFPKGKVFGFDAEAVRQELSFQEVPQEDQPFLIDALSQIGMFPYRLDTGDKKGKKDKVLAYRVFRIGLVTGTISTTLLN